MYKNNKFATMQTTLTDEVSLQLSCSMIYETVTRKCMKPDCVQKAITSEKVSQLSPKLNCRDL